MKTPVFSFKNRIKNDKAAFDNVEKKADENQDAAKAKEEEARRKASESRMYNVIDRMYKLIVSADLDANSFYVESRGCTLGDVELPRRGYFDSLVDTMADCFLGRDRDAFNANFSRNNLFAIFSEGRTYLEGLFKAGEEEYNIRVERIPEIEPNSIRIRCCMFIRPVSSEEDDGVINKFPVPRSENDLSETDKLFSDMFISCYEINLEKNFCFGYDKKNGVFVKRPERYNLVATIKSSINKGLVAPESVDVVKNLVRPKYLYRHTLNGYFSVEMKLRKPGTEFYRWYRDVIFPIGSNFRIYRAYIDEAKAEQAQHEKAIEDMKLFDYNRTMLRTMASVVEFRNIENGAHIARVNEITKILLDDIKERSPHYELTNAKIQLYTEASTIHDIGKITTPDSILNKKGILTPEEFAEIQLHTVNGAKIIERMNSKGQEELYDTCKDIALHHHERYDGHGYPEGLVGDEISIGAQAVGMADAYDALVSPRVYKNAYSHETAYDYIVNGKCGAFNPRLIKSLDACRDKIKEIYAKENKNIYGEE